MRALLSFIVQEIEQSSFCLLSIRDQITHSMRVKRKTHLLPNLHANNNATLTTESVFFKIK